MTHHSKTPRITPADIILAQLGGGNRLSAIIGAKGFFSDNGGNTLVFKFTARATNGINYVKVTLNQMDTYDIEFIKVGKKKDKELGVFMPVQKVISTLKGYYFDMLEDGFVSETGLNLTLGEIVVKKPVT